MDSRTRVKAAVAHKEPDRVPIDLWGSASRLHNGLYENLCPLLGLDPMKEKARPGTLAEYVDYRISDMFGVDFRHIVIGKPVGYKSYIDDKGNAIDEWGIGHKMSDAYNTISFHPLADPDPDRLDHYPWPNPTDPGRIAGIADIAKDWYENTSFAITSCTATSGFFFDFGQYLCGAEQFFTNLYLEEYFTDKLMDKLEEVFTALHLHFLEPIAPYLEWVEFASDFGTQTGPFISVELFRRFFKKPMTHVFSAIKKKYPHLKIFLHCCGSNIVFIPDFIECGVDILNSLQPLAKDMDQVRIKREFGDALVLHSGVDIQHATQGTPEEVVAEVHRAINAMALGGGYIFAPANHLQKDMPAKNFSILYNEARRYGQYPIG